MTPPLNDACHRLLAEAIAAQDLRVAVVAGDGALPNALRTDQPQRQVVGLSPGQGFDGLTSQWDTIVIADLGAVPDAPALLTACRQRLRREPASFLPYAFHARPRP